jgi:hypothetical protein
MTSLASTPETMPSTAGQLSGSMPMGANSGVATRLVAARMELSLSPESRLPSVPMAPSRFSASTMTMMTRPASRRNSLTRSQVRSSTPRRVGRW